VISTSANAAFDPLTRLNEIIRTRRLAKLARERDQRQLWTEDEHHHETIRAKLNGLVENSQFFNFSRCGLDAQIFVCKSCGERHEFKYRCTLKWCPRCQWQLAEVKKKFLVEWAKNVPDPLHMILTQKNWKILTRKKLDWLTERSAMLRASKCFKKVRGGCVSVEVTNIGNGWHPHNHWLLDVDWIDYGAVRRTWSKLVGQEDSSCEFVRVKNSDFVQEVCKYVVEGSEMASWDAELIAEFVLAVRGKRFFTPFGNLRKAGEQIRAILRQQAGEGFTCECGSSQFRFTTELDEEVGEIERDAKREKKLAKALTRKLPCPTADVEGPALFADYDSPGKATLSALAR
jgi:hypothetical protein